MVLYWRFGRGWGIYVSSLPSLDDIFPQILDRYYTDNLFQICLPSVDYIFSADLRQMLYRYSVSNLFAICGLYFPQILDRCYTDILFQICLSSVDYIFAANLRQMLYRYSVSNLFYICGLYVSADFRQMLYRYSVSNLFYICGLYFPQILDRCYTDILFQICLTSVDYIFRRS